MRDLRDLGQRPDLAGHVAGARRGHEVRVLAAGQLLEGRGELLEHGGGRLGHRQIANTDPLPRQQVGVVLAGEGDDVRAVRQRAGQQVDRIGRVAGDDHRIVVASIHESANRLAGAFVGSGRGSRLEPGAAMDARVPLQELLDGVVDRLERGRRGRVVEVHVAPGPARDEGHLDVGTDQAQRFAAMDRCARIRRWLSGGGHRRHPTPAPIRQDGSPAGPIARQASLIV